MFNTSLLFMAANTALPIPSSLTTSLVAYWSLDNVLTNAVSGSFNLAASGTSAFSTTNFLGSHSRYFSAAGSIQTTTNIFTSTTQARSVSFWVKFDLVTQTTTHLFCSYSNGEWFIRVGGSSTSNIQIQSFVKIGASYYATGAPTMTKTNWNHIVGTILPTGTGNSIKLYVNGTLHSSKNLTNTALADASGNNTALGGNAQGSERVKGAYIDETAVWQKELTASEVTALYNNGSGLTYSSGTFNYP